MLQGFPGGTNGKESACQYRRYKIGKFVPWVRKIPCSIKWHPTPQFLPGKFHGQRSLAAEQLSTLALCYTVKVKVTQLCLFATPRTIDSMNSPGQNTGVASHSLFQWIFPTQGLNPGLPHCWRILCQVSHQGSVLNSRSLLIIYFVCSNVYMSIPLSQLIPPSLPAANCKFVFYISVSYFVNKFICTLFLDSTYKRYHMILVFLCLT